MPELTIRQQYKQAYSAAKYLDRSGDEFMIDQLAKTVAQPIIDAAKVSARVRHYTAHRRAQQLKWQYNLFVMIAPPHAKAIMKIVYRMEYKRAVQLPE